MESSVIEMLEKHSWPNNVHDIEDLMEYCLKNLVDNSIQKASLPKDFA
jgi:transcriptional regulator with PAS, ATPase and Fis domain